VFLRQLLSSFESWWGALASWQKLEPEQQHALIQLVERTYKDKVDMLRQARDRRLNAILKALDESRADASHDAAE
jgi:hypothetical protein